MVDMGLLKKVTEAIVTAQNYANPQNIKKRLYDKVARMAEDAGNVTGSVVGEGASGFTKGATGTYLESMGREFKDSGLMNISLYGGSAALLIYGIDKLLDKDKDETPYRMFKRKAKGIGALAISAACLGFGLYNQYSERRSDSTQDS
ncbi:hypothetical protein A3K63_03395 [Candidatus Micrarchaeota archaeon RBG_16_49_10]|nr:MAG: hypothetical protein A3K63_03395 [Candidatus Micrarchaeota archaeon RBG_16_49_10]